MGEVIEYRDNKVPIRNDFTQIPYPYVKIQNELNDAKLIKLKYANNIIKPFKIGEKVEVFWYGGELYFWNAYDRGILKFLPKKSIF